MNLKKITALMIGAVMAVSMAAPAMADDKVETVTDGKLTVATSLYGVYARQSGIIAVVIDCLRAFHRKRGGMFGFAVPVPFAHNAAEQYVEMRIKIPLAHHGLTLLKAYQHCFRNQPVNNFVRRRGAVRTLLHYQLTYQITRHRSYFLLTKLHLALL